MNKFKFLEHTADVKIQSFGKTLDESFENAALAMFSHMHDKKIKSKIKKTIQACGKDLESLLYNFLEELLFLLDSENFFLSKCRVTIKNDKKSKKYNLKAELSGDDVVNYKANLDIKAITYNEMFVKQEKNKFICQFVLDV